MTTIKKKETPMIYTLHDPQTKEYLSRGLMGDFMPVEEFKHALMIHSTEELEAYCLEYPQVKELLVRCHMVKTCDLTNGTVKEVLEMSGVAIDDVGWVDADICRNG